MKILFLLLTLIPIFEITIFIIFSRFIGFLYLILEILITFSIGFFIFSRSKKNLIDYKDNNSFSIFSLNKMLFENKKLFFFRLIGSILLIIPGCITDIIGVLVMLKPVQIFIIKYTITSLKDPFQKNNFSVNGAAETIEGEFYDLHNDKSKISKK